MSDRYTKDDNQTKELEFDDRIRVKVREKDHGRKVKVIVKHDHFKLSLRFVRTPEDDDD